jgi:hypothetical protein
MGSILGSKRGPKTRFSADSVKNAFRTCFSTIFACKNEFKTQAFCEQPYAGKSCKARSAAKCGCAESYVKYSVRGLCGKTPKIEAATEELQKSTKKRQKNGAKKRREKQDRRDPTNTKNDPKTVLPGTPGPSRDARNVDFGGPGEGSKFRPKNGASKNRFFPRLGRF